MRVYVCTKAENFGPEIYMDVKKSRNEAEQYISSLFPKIKVMTEGVSYYCRNSDGKAVLCFIREEEL